MAIMNPFTALAWSVSGGSTGKALSPPPLLFQNGKQACRTGARTMELAVTVITSYCDTKLHDATVFEVQN